MTMNEAEKNRCIFAKNFNYYLIIKGKTQNDIVRDLQITACQMAQI